MKLLRWLGIHSMQIVEWVSDPEMDIEETINRGQFIRLNNALSRRMVLEYLLKKFDYRCAYCGNPDDNFEVDHIIPKSKRGTEHIYNLVLSCHKCNLRKSTSSWIRFGAPSLGRTKYSNYDIFPLHMVRYKIDDRKEWQFGEKENDSIPFGFSFMKTKERRFLIYKSRKRFNNSRQYGILRGNVILLGRNP